MKTITLARKSFVGTVAKNVMEHGCGGLNIDACRIGSGDDRTVGGSSGSTALFGSDKPSTDRPTGGRFPANLILEGGCPVKALDDQSAILKSGAMDSIAKGGQHTTYGKMYERRVFTPASEVGASRFFKQVKS